MGASRHPLPRSGHVGDELVPQRPHPGRRREHEPSDNEAIALARARRCRSHIGVDMSRSFLIAVTMLAALVAPAAGAEVPPQYRGLWLKPGMARITAAERPPVRAINTSVVIASNSPRKAIAASLPSRRPPRVTACVCTAPRTYSRTHPNMSICGSTPAAACASTSARV